MSDPLRVLIVEDLEADALLVERELRRGGFSPVCRRVESAEGMTEALTSEPWDVIISDHGMPGFSAPAALATLQGLKLDVPFIIVSGSIGEELAVDAMRSGAADFILKGSLMKLPAAVTRELRDAAERRTRHETERRLRESEERFRLLVEQVPGITYEAEYDAVFRPIFVSRQILSLSGFQPAQWLSAGDFWTEHIHQEDRARVEGERRRAREAGSPFSSSYRIVGKDGRVNWWQDCAKISPGPAGAPAVFRGVVVDVTEQVRAEETIREVAYHDRLTGLPNRTYFEHLLREEITDALAREGTVAVLSVRPLRFAEVVSTLGARCGDHVASETGRRIRECLPPSATLGRIDADLFSVALPGERGDGAMELARRIVKGVGRPFAVENVPLEIECAVGIAIHPDDGETSELLMRRADVALEVGRCERLPVATYERHKDPFSPRRLRLLGELREAIQAGQLFLEYQPKVSLTERRVRGLEALVRWRHPKHGVVPPGVFLEAVEPTALMGPLTGWVVSQALRHCRDGLRAGIGLPVAVNISARDLDDPELPDRILEALTSFGVAPSLLELEVTESAILGTSASPQESLERLSARGVRIAIDDFGTGFSSLKRLRTFPVSAIKIDQSFVAGMTTSKDDAIIVRSSTHLAHDLGLIVVAEGVEDEPTWRALAEAGCDEAQGYWMARPMGAERLETWLAESPYGLGLAIEPKRSA